MLPLFPAVPHEPVPYGAPRAPPEPGLTLVAPLLFKLLAVVASKIIPPAPPPPPWPPSYMNKQGLPGAQEPSSPSPPSPPSALNTPLGPM